MRCDVLITVGSDTITMTWNGAEATAPILLDGVATGYQTADARHDLERAAHLAVERAFGPVAWDEVVVRVAEID